MMRFPTNLIVAVAYRILFHKLEFDIEFTNPPKVNSIACIGGELTEILERRRSFLLSFDYLERDEVKKIPSSPKFQLIGV
jgi:hypothetical protein